jgi:predicted PurR-regulated permease PerM
MSTSTQASDGRLTMHRAVEVAIRLGLVFLLAAWCFLIVEPFIIMILWGLIIAIACYPLYAWMTAKLGGHDKLTAVVFTLLALAILITPTFMLIETAAETTQVLSTYLQEGKLTVPPPPPGVEKWPVIGKEVSAFWSGASENLGATLTTIAPHLKEAAGWLLSTAAGAGIGVIQFVIAIIIAGVFLAHDEGIRAFLASLATRLSGTRGVEYAMLAGKTVRSVAQGVLGVALIQTLLAAVGLLAVDVPGAGLWALIVLMLAIIQLPPLLVLGPIIVYVFYTSSTTVAIIFMIWSIFAGSSDAILKPLLLGRGVEVPMLIILIGAIGGMIHSGIIGLFIGAVILALGYELFKAWLKEGLQATER